MKVGDLVRHPRSNQTGVIIREHDCDDEGPRFYTVYIGWPQGNGCGWYNESELEVVKYKPDKK